MGKRKGVCRGLGVVLLVALVTLPACAGRHYRKGNHQMELGHTTEAIAHYKVAVEKDPDNPVYLYALGTAYLHDSAYARAVRVLSRAAELAPDDPDTLEKLAFGLVKLGDKDRAVEVYWHLFSSEPDRKDVYDKLVTLLEAAERFDEAAEATLLFSTQPGFDPAVLNAAAEKYLRIGEDAAATRLIVRSLELNRNQAALWRILGEQQSSHGNARAAVESFSAAHRLDPSDVATMVGYAGALRKIGELDQARELYEQALAREPDLKDARVALVEIYLAQDRLDEAASFAREAMIRFPNDPSIKALKGAVHLARQEWSQAVAVLTLAVKRSEQADPQILAMLGQAYLELGERARARLFFNRALGRDPNTGEANLGLCQLDLEDRREAQGIERCQLAMRQAPELRDRAVAIMTAYYEADERYRRVMEIEEEAATLSSAEESEAESSSKEAPATQKVRPAVADEARKRLQELQELREILEAIPEEERAPRDWYELGQVCFKLEDLEAAEKALTRAWKHDPDNLEYRGRMAEVLLAEQKYDSALVHFREIVREDENNVGARISLVQALLGRGEAEETLDILSELREIDPENPQVFELSAEAYFELGLLEQAGTFQETATRLRKGGS